MLNQRMIRRHVTPLIPVAQRLIRIIWKGFGANYCATLGLNSRVTGRVSTYQSATLDLEFTVVRNLRLLTIIFPWKWDKEGTIVQIVRFLIQFDWFRVRWNVFKFYFLSAQYKRFKKFKIKENFGTKRNSFWSFFHFWALFNSIRIRRKYI